MWGMTRGGVIACVDDGPGGAAVARVGGSLARRLCVPLTLATVTAADAPGVDGDASSSSVEHGRSVLLRQGASILADAAAGVGPDPKLWVEHGEPAERLASLAQRTDARLIVVGVPDDSAAPGRWLGNAYLALAATSPCPVVAVPPSARELPAPPAPVICGVDGSDESLAAVRLAVSLGRSLDAPVQLVHVTDQPRLSGSSPAGNGARLVASHAAAMRILLRAAEVPAAALDLRVELGGPAERLAEVARRECAQLIVNGSTGRGGRRSALLGSVSSCLALTAAQPLVLVRAHPRPARELDRRIRPAADRHEPRVRRRSPLRDRVA
jgi:nucleotide-binding universal stress UspA family protein